jgi:type IX secretion system PorP/SprF family membrane protein
MKKLIIILSMCVSASIAVGQHNIITSQYLQNALPLNPAVAGNAKALAATVSYRNEWLGIEGAPQSAVFSIHTPLRNDRVALGLNVWQDSYGTTVSRVVKGIGAYRLRLKNARLTFALSLGFRSQVVNYDDLVLYDEQDAVLNRGVLGGTEFEGGAGVYFNNDRMFFSLSVPNIGNYPGGNLLWAERIEDDLLRRQIFFAGGGYRWTLNDDFKLRSVVFSSFDYFKLQMLDLSLFVNYNDFVEIGAGLRSGKGIMSSARFWVTQQLSLAYAYEFWLTPNAPGRGGSHEWVLRYTLNHSQNTPNPHLF